MKSTQVRRRRDATFWKAINRVLMVLVLIGLVSVIVLWFYPELERRDAMARELDEEKQDLAAQQLLRKQREREVYLLENDREYIETIARDKLDMMKEGETIYRLESAKGPEIAKP